MVEMVFSDDLKFIKFGSNVTEEEAKEIWQEIHDSCKEQNII